MYMAIQRYKHANFEKVHMNFALFSVNNICVEYCISLLFIAIIIVCFPELIKNYQPKTFSKFWLK